MKSKNSILLKSLLLFPVFIALLLTESCNNSSDVSLVIEGKIDGCSERTLVVESLMPNRVDTLQTVKTGEDGSFKIELDTVPGGFLRLKVDHNNGVFLFGRKGDEILVNGNYPGLVKSYTLSGSEDSELLRQMNLRLIESSDQLNLMKNKIIESSSDPNCNIDSLYEVSNEIARQLYESDKQYLKDFISKNEKSPVIYMALYQYIGTSPILMIENDLETFKFVLNSLNENNPELPHITLLESVISKEELRQQQLNREYVDISVGAEAPDFSLQNIDEKKVSLSAFLGTKTIIAFWSSWNKTSVDNLKYIKELAAQENINVIAIALDTNREKWEAAIKSCEIGEFQNVCDFKSWESTVVKIYGVRSLPAYVLVNEESVIDLLTDDVFILKDKIED